MMCPACYFRSPRCLDMNASTEDFVQKRPMKPDTLANVICNEFPLINRFFRPTYILVVVFVIGVALVLFTLFYAEEGWEIFNTSATILQDLTFTRQRLLGDVTTRGLKLQPNGGLYPTVDSDDKYHERN